MSNLQNLLNRRLDEIQEQVSRAVGGSGEPRPEPAGDDEAVGAMKTGDVNLADTRTLEARREILSEAETADATRAPQPAEGRSGA
jgi:hypothetical protein